MRTNRPPNPADGPRVEATRLNVFSPEHALPQLRSWRVLARSLPAGSPARAKVGAHHRRGKKLLRWRRDLKTRLAQAGRTTQGDFAVRTRRPLTASDQADTAVRTEQSITLGGGAHAEYQALHVEAAAFNAAGQALLQDIDVANAARQLSSRQATQLTLKLPTSLSPAQTDLPAWAAAIYDGIQTINGSSSHLERLCKRPSTKPAPGRAPLEPTSSDRASPNTAEKARPDAARTRRTACILR